MKIVTKERPKIKLALGDVIEYEGFITNSTVRAMIVMGHDSNGKYGYLALNLELFKIMGVTESYDDLESMYNALKDNEDFHIIKSSNLELREV